jgi:hypothetical protein
MHKLIAPLFLAVALALASCSSSDAPPSFVLPVPSAFGKTVDRHAFRRGESLGEGAPYESEKATSALTRIGGEYAKGDAHWSVEVTRGAAPNVLRALATAKDGYDANLGYLPGFAPVLYARFARKQFRWGDAVSFLVQYQVEAPTYAPNNDRLTYEVHGVTKDHRYTVRAIFFDIQHPGLKLQSQTRSYREDSSKPDAPIRRDPAYILVEHCPDTAFQPSIKDIDAILNELKLGVAK